MKNIQIDIIIFSRNSNTSFLAFEYTYFFNLKLINNSTSLYSAKRYGIFAYLSVIDYFKQIYPYSVSY